jgi:hypothetical protein
VCRFRVLYFEMCCCNSEGSSKLGLLSGGPPFLFDMLLAIEGG